MVGAGTKDLAPTQSLVIDLDRGTVTIGSIGELSIVKRTDLSVAFKGSSGDGQWTWQGDIDRFSGLATLTVWHYKEVVVHYNLTCRRPEPLF